MGGNVFKRSLDCVRLNKEQYDEITQHVNEVFCASLPETVRFDFIRAIESKESFGDMDVLWCTTNNDRFVKHFLPNLDVLAFSENGNISSIALNTVYGPFQIDFIKVKPQVFDFALAYFNYNDLGNLLGRVFHKAGFKLGWNGLRYVVRDPVTPSHVLDEVVVTVDWESALDFMGYENYYEKEFNTLEDLFLYTATSPFFNREIYLLENRNHVSRTRDRKRPTYNAFLKWLDSEGAMIELPQFDWNLKDTLRRLFLEKAKDTFPFFEEKLEKIEKIAIRRKSIHSKFNGSLVREWTGLEGKELGREIEKFYNHFENRSDAELFIENSKDMRLDFFNLMGDEK